VTSVNLFSRAVGSAVGVAIFGAIVNATLGTHTSLTHPSVAGRDALMHASRHVFIGVLVVALLLFAAIFFMPRGGHLAAGNAVPAKPDIGSGTEPVTL